MTGFAISSLTPYPAKNGKATKYWCQIQAFNKEQHVEGRVGIEQ
jgi:hypothetical protein